MMELLVQMKKILDLCLSDYDYLCWRIYLMLVICEQNDQVVIDEYVWSGVVVIFEFKCLFIYLL